jgi:hypothetical protein
MILKTMYAASKIKYAPSRGYLSRQSKETPRPEYFFNDSGELRIDINHPSWIDMMDRRREEQQLGIKNGLPASDSPLVKKSKIVKNKKKDESEILIESLEESLKKNIGNKIGLIKKIKKDLFMIYQDKISI